MDSKKSHLSRFRRHMAQDVHQDWSDIILVVLSFISGMVDSAVFNTWSCFVSMQTGNTVYVGLGVSGQPYSQPYRWAKSSTAIASFCLGCFVFSRVSRVLKPLKRSTMVASMLVQVVLCFVAFGLVVSGFVPKDAGDRLPHDFIVLLPLSLLSFQSAGQIVMSRFLGFNELPTVVLTSTYCDLFMDSALFTTPIVTRGANLKRNRRFISVIALVVGAAASGFLTEDGDIGHPLWITGVLKIAIGCVWVFWQGKGAIRLE
ncbi:uncharacterized protein HMPREF1541_07140 [Cyphellophora europaea CBS 101466]|uniref:DUF1275 domain protein n=1 Tax=Cyphellophora europaea (strain CBS 101466) TaxID=1220924 RepID=W2RPA3_CYPE1|nr:uncharacterized protein HMPREF1541_07140 [Cyphellophora europaea CBS 101466]ETN37518.1 hypothetical protein HMPREF1541_07140 [Cyphellophora europaea CBS 101466]